MNTESRLTIQNREIPEKFKQLLELDIINDWLATYDIKSRPQKKHNLDMFLGWLGKSPEETLALRKNDNSRSFEKLCLKWLTHMIEKEDFKTSTALNKLGTIRSWFQYHDMPLRFKRNELPRPQPSPRKFSLTIDHVRHMWTYFPLWLQAISIIALENGLRISDVLSLKRSDVENMLSQEFPSMEITTEKTGVLAKIHLSNEAISILQAYLKTVPKQERLFIKDSDTVNKRLQKAFKLAYPNIDFKPTFKSFRQIFLSTGSNCGINQWHLRYMCGKAVDASILPYLRNLDFRADFVKIKARLTIQQLANNRVPKLQEILECVVSALLPLVEAELAKRGVHTLKEAKPVDLLQVYHKLLEAGI